MTANHCRGVVIGTLVVLFAAAAPTAPAQPALRVRRNIDQLSSQELQDYVHAFELLRDRPETEMDSLASLIKLHNGGVLPNGQAGGCLHASEMFLPWHRLLLLEFERALREVDPPRTSQATIPYWDFTVVGSGRLFAAAFEDGATPMWHRRRLQPVPIPPTIPGYPQAVIDALNFRRDLLAGPDWHVDVMREATTYAAFGGAAPGYGRLEREAHNEMHGWVGHGSGIVSGAPRGSMSVDTTAARDPIFWSYHAHIDLLWDEWQQIYGARSPDAPAELLPTDLDESFAHFKNPTPVRKLLNVEDLGYKYDAPAPTPAPPPAPPLLEVVQLAEVERAEPLAGAQFALPLGVVAAAEQTQLAGLDVELTDVQAPADQSWRIELYVHPENVAFQPDDPEFRRAYFAGYSVKWRSGAGHAEGHEHAAEATPDAPLKVTVRRSALERLRTAGDQPWTLSPRVEVVDPPADLTAEAAAAMEWKKPLGYSGARMIVQRKPVQ